MNRQLDVKKMKKWRDGQEFQGAIELVKNALQCSRSKAEKIVGCRYPSTPQPLEQIALATLLGISRDELYPVAGKPRARAS